MKRLIYLAVFLATSVIGTTPSRGDFLLSFGSAPLANNSADARLTLYAAWDGNGINQIAGMQLTAAIGDGSSTQTLTPTFRGTQNTRQGIILTGNTSQGATVWQTSLIQQSNDTLAFGSAPETGNSFRVSNVGIIDLSGQDFHAFSSTPEVIAEFRLNTLGVSDKRFAFTIGTIGAATSFVTDGLQNVNLSFSGTFDVGTVTAVPEPSSIAILALGGIVTARFRRKRRLQQCAKANQSKDQG